MNTAEQVHTIMEDCLFKTEEMKDLPEGTVPEGAVLVKGIVVGYGFHPERLESHKEEIRTLLNEMPDEFHTGRGGGHSFLQLYMNKHGEHWGEHPAMEALIALGIGTGMAKYCLPREVWSSLPGGMPYIVFDTNAVKSQDGEDQKCECHEGKERDNDDRQREVDPTTSSPDAGQAR